MAAFIERWVCANAAGFGPMTIREKMKKARRLFLVGIFRGLSRSVMRVSLRRYTKECRSKNGQRVQLRKRQSFYFFVREFQMNRSPGPRTPQRTNSIFPARKAACRRLRYSPNRNPLTA